MGYKWHRSSCDTEYHCPWLQTLHVSCRSGHARRWCPLCHQTTRRATRRTTRHTTKRASSGTMRWATRRPMTQTWCTMTKEHTTGVAGSAASPFLGGEDPGSR
ncbi:hypothetical protein FKM82_029608 [Ascaphus truei]